jgi:hypothetical protein
MDDGGDVVVAQPGPIDGEVREPQPFTWIHAAGWCLIVSIYVAMVASGIAALFVRPFDCKADGLRGGLCDEPVIVFKLIGFMLIFSGFHGAACVGRALVKRCRSAREVDAMTRLHVVPVSRRR